MSNRQYYAHTLEAPHSVAEWEPLGKHLDDVSKMAAEFASAFGAAEWGAIAGRWHDLGKYSAEFQQYLLRCADPDASEIGPGRVDHSTFGARHAQEQVGGHRGRLLAFCIAGHHAGLPNAYAPDAAQERSTLEYRLSHTRIPEVSSLPQEEIQSRLALPFAPSGPEAGFQIAFFTRMLFSALVDADRLATEAFCDPGQAAERRASRPSIAALLFALESYLERKQSGAEKTAVNQARASVLADCIAAAELAPGFFSLNVPTGGGKTLSSLMFSLRHASMHDLRRVVVAVPFTTIIEQTADEYRKALGQFAEGAVVEHHSNIHPSKDSRQNKLATENWDAPLIVTTNVQLYESLFASATTPCRKIHRLAKSVIVLDEAQTIPVEHLHPTLLALAELVLHYGCTVVLSTATQPALERRDGFDIGIEPGLVRPIVPKPDDLFRALKRAQIVRLGKLSDADLAARLGDEPSVLCIVNTRRHASKVYDLLADRAPPDSCFHLSTLMCAEHRRSVLAKIRQLLKEGQSCRVVSTQLIEAGVDLDFPCVYRAPAGFDSVAQAAGRCNREGSLPAGKVFFFETECLPPPGLLRYAAQCGRELSGSFDDPFAPEAVDAYFRRLYWSQQHRWDSKQVLECFEVAPRQRELPLQFREASSRYKLIENQEQAPILVPYNEEAGRIRGRLLKGEPADFKLLRSAQTYLVNVWSSFLAELEKQNLVWQHESGLWLLLNEKAYTQEKGLSVEASGIDPELLIG